MPEKEGGGAMLMCFLKHTFTRGILYFTAAQAVAIGSAVAVCFKPNPRVCAEFFHSDAVFVGTVVAEIPVLAGEGFDEGRVYRLRARKTYRGPAQDMFEVFTGNDSARLPLDVGETYLLFASTSGGRLTIVGCGNSTKLSKAGDAIRELENLIKRLKSATDGEVSGVVGEYVGNDAPGVAGVLVTAHGGGKSYEGVTGKDGSFHIPVPPGAYVVSARSARGAVIPYDLSYDDPQHVVVHKCGCTAIQLLLRLSL
jgi:hypothetical protein